MSRQNPEFIAAQQLNMCKDVYYGFLCSKAVHKGYDYEYIAEGSQVNVPCIELVFMLYAGVIGITGLAAIPLTYLIARNANDSVNLPQLDRLNDFDRSMILMHQREMENLSNPILPGLTSAIFEVLRRLFKLPSSLTTVFSLFLQFIALILAVFIYTYAEPLEEMNTSVVGQNLTIKSRLLDGVNRSLPSAGTLLLFGMHVACIVSTFTECWSSMKKDRFLASFALHSLANLEYFEHELEENERLIEPDESEDGDEYVPYRARG